VLGQLRQCIDHFWKGWTQFYLKGMSANRFPQGTPGFVELRPNDRVFFRRSEKFHRLQDSPALEAGVIRRTFQSGDGIARRFEIEDQGGNTVEIPLKRIFLSDQAMIDLRGSASGIAPSQ
jgi:hypothetical protein